MQINVYFTSRVFNVALAVLLLVYRQPLFAQSDPETPAPRIVITLNEHTPSQSHGTWQDAHSTHSFPVGFGKKGLLNEGERFKDGYTLLGLFEVTGILTADRMVLAPELLRQSNKTKEYLESTLFKNMNSIDFDNDGKTAEYGSAYIVLKPLSDTPQPFTFGPYKNIYRLYHFAIHGTNDPERVGKSSTGGCINVRESDLRRLVQKIHPGDRVRIVRSVTP